jgi:integrase
MVQLPRAINYKLNDKAVQAAKPKEKAYPLTDGGGLFLEVLPSGGKVWRFAYMVAGKRGKVTLGTYPTMGIKSARDAHEANRAMLAAGDDPARQKQLSRVEAEAKAAQAQTFETFARIWFSESKMAQVTARTKKQSMAWMENDVFPSIGGLSLGDVRAADVLKLLEKMRNTPTKANNIRAMIERIYQYSAQKLLTTTNPATPMAGLIHKPPASHYEPLKAGEVRGFMEALRSCGAHHGTRLAVEFLAYTVVRKDNVCKARWEHIDMEAKTWTIPGRTVGGNGFMKMPRPHTVYLSTQAAELLLRARELSASSEWVFPSVQSLALPMSEVAINHLFSRLRLTGDIPDRIKPHGLRSTFSTFANESGISPDVVESILAHLDRNATRSSYNRATYDSAMRSALQWYADHLDKLIMGGDVIKFKVA